MAAGIQRCLYCSIATSDTELFRSSAPPKRKKPDETHKDPPANILGQTPWDKNCPVAWRWTDKVELEHRTDRTLLTNYTHVLFSWSLSCILKCFEVTRARASLR